MRKKLTIIIVLIFIILMSTSAFAIEDDSLDIINTEFDNNTLIVGDYIFDLNITNDNSYNLNNFVTATRTAFINVITSDNELYYKDNGHWINLISNEEVSVNEINGNGKVKYYQMEKIKSNSIKNINVVSNNILRIYFNEGVIESEIDEYSNYRIINGNEDKPIRNCIYYSSNNNTEDGYIEITINDQLEENTTYEAVVPFNRNINGIIFHMILKKTFEMSEAKEPVIAVSIDNYDSAKQIGLNNALVNIETEVAPGITRFLSVFNINDIAEDYVIGPVRSARTYFVELSEGFNGGFAHCGGSTDSLNQIVETSLINLDEIYGSGSYFYRDNELSAPHNLFTTINNLKSGMNNKGTINSETKELFKRGSVSGGTEATEAVINYSNNFTTSFKWNEVTQQYERYENNILDKQKDDSKIVTNNVVIAYTDYENGKLKVTGGNIAHIYRNGKLYIGRWEKANSASEIKFFVNDEEFSFENGSIWISFADAINNQQNFDESKAPKFNRVIALSNTEIKLEFDKEIDIDSLDIEIIDKYGHGSDLEVLNAEYVNGSVILETSSQNSGSLYVVIINKVSDLEGNISFNITQSFGGIGIKISDAAQKLINYGIIDADYISENNSLTRAEMIVLLETLLGEDKAAAEFVLSSTFVDVDTDAWYAHYVAYAELMGYIQSGDGCFRPNDYITEDEACLMILTTLEYETNIEISIPDALALGIENNYENERFVRGSVYDMLVDMLNTKRHDSDSFLGVELGYLDKVGMNSVGYISHYERIDNIDYVTLKDLYNSEKRYAVNNMPNEILNQTIISYEIIEDGVIQLNDTISRDINDNFTSVVGIVQRIYGDYFNLEKNLMSIEDYNNLENWISTNIEWYDNVDTKCIYKNGVQIDISEIKNGDFIKIVKNSDEEVVFVNVFDVDKENLNDIETQKLLKAFVMQSDLISDYNSLYFETNNNNEIKFRSSEITYVGGIINEDTVLEKANSPYFFEESIQVDKDISLTIEPGAIIYGNNKTLELFSSILLMEGNQDNNIIINDLSIQTNNKYSELTEINIDYALLDGKSNLKLQGIVSLANSSFSNFSGISIYSDNIEDNILIQNSKFNMINSVEILLNAGTDVNNLISRNIFNDSQLNIEGYYGNKAKLVINNNLFAGRSKIYIGYARPYEVVNIVNNTFDVEEYAIRVDSNTSSDMEINANDNYFNGLNLNDAKLKILDHEDDLNIENTVIIENVLEESAINTPETVIEDIAGRNNDDYLEEYRINDKARVEAVIATDIQTIRVYFDRDVTGPAFVDNKIWNENTNTLIDFVFSYSVDGINFITIPGTVKAYQDSGNDNVLVIRTTDASTFSSTTATTFNDVFKLKLSKDVVKATDSNDTILEFANNDDAPSEVEIDAVMAIDSQTIRVYFDMPVVVNKNFAEIGLEDSDVFGNSTNLTLLNASKYNEDDLIWEFTLSSAMASGEIYFLVADPNITTTNLSDIGEIVTLKDKDETVPLIQHKIEFAGVYYSSESINDIGVIMVDKRTMKVYFPEVMNLTEALDLDNYAINTLESGLLENNTIAQPVLSADSNDENTIVTLHLNDDIEIDTTTTAYLVISSDIDNIDGTKTVKPLLTGLTSLTNATQTGLAIEFAKPNDTADRPLIESVKIDDDRMGLTVKVDKIVALDDSYTLTMNITNDDLLDDEIIFGDESEAQATANFDAVDFNKIFNVNAQLVGETKDILTAVSAERINDGKSFHVSFEKALALSTEGYVTTETDDNTMFIYDRSGVAAGKTSENSSKVIFAVN